MIDRINRDRLAEALRHLVAGLISNNEYENRIRITRGRLAEALSLCYIVAGMISSSSRIPPMLKDRDRAVEEIFDESSGLFSDLHEYRLRGKYRLRRDTRIEVARWILFLKSDLPYEWPPWPQFSLHLTFGLLVPFVRRWFRRFGDFDVWPFIRRADYEKCLTMPPYFAGSSTPLSTHNLQSVSMASVNNS